MPLNISHRDSRYLGYCPPDPQILLVSNKTYKLHNVNLYSMFGLTVWRTSQKKMAKHVNTEWILQQQQKSQRITQFSVLQDNIYKYPQHNIW